jgi:tetratricopeptide (TPR) repeat protein
MTFRKFVLPFATVVLIMSTSSMQASDAWRTWGSLRWSGLQQFAKGNNEAASQDFEKALAEATRVNSGSVNEVISTYDLAQVYQAENKLAQAEDFCSRALSLSKKVCVGPDRVITTLILDSLAFIKRGENKVDEVAMIDAEADKLADSSPDAQTIGAATMDADGTIRLELRAADAGMIGHAGVSYAPTDPKYKDTLMHLGPLKPGGSKLVAPWK